MTRKLLKPMPQAIVDTQRRASDPDRSIWVTANAGSGKTYVLTARVLRLLLSGVKPEEILCLTYTKAAAAEMRGRVAERLAQWSLLDEGALVADLAALSGQPPTPAMLLRARSLFAHALETPGGLKIQTIHAFCEAVLHRFPHEAGVPFDFSVLEDHERERLLLEAREQVIAAGLRGSGEAAAVDTLFDLLSDFQITTAIGEALGAQRTLRRLLPHAARAKANLRHLVGNVGSIEDVLTEIAEGYGPSAADHTEIFRLVAPDPAGSEFIDRLSRIDPDRPDPDALLEAFLTLDGTARKSLLRKNIATLIPGVAAKLVDEADRLEAMRIRLTRAELVERSNAMLDIVAAISAHYERAKRARSLLDFDDLVERMNALLRDRVQGDWVRYKLDAGISHILVDEGQDTNPEQWEVIDQLVEDFFVGDSAADRPRTLFAVGDQKQSIFSFQGADPQEFLDAGSRYRLSARAVQFEIERVPLHYSFRTLPNVLKAVDRVFMRPELRAGVLAEGDLLHETARAEGGGVVTLWPPIKEIEADIDPDNWPTVAPDAVTKSAPRRVAERIAREIRFWLANNRPLGPRGRPVRAEDVLILVQVRSVLFHEIIRALIREGVPTPGADRLAVTTHIGVLDLMALGDVLNNIADDLQLAALLRSPLFEISEDELYELANPRQAGEWLWAAMERSSIPSVKAAAIRLNDWRDRLDFDRPFNFFADVLYAGGGLKKFRARLGAEVDDLMAEFLDLALAYEQEPQPSLLGFLASLRNREVIIKRELGEAGSGVRVMTVHGAKGLEAPVVILADAASTEEGRDRRSIFMQMNPPLFVHASSKATHAPETMDHRDEAEAAQKAEYWRKLYVAMTRAEDELYVTGYLTKARDGKQSWYEAIEEALRDEAEIVADAEGNATALIYPRERGATTMTAAVAEAADAAMSLGDLPPIPLHHLRRIVRPSAIDAPEESDADDALAAYAETGERRSPDLARREGIALHALLQHLAPVLPLERPAMAESALSLLLPDLPGEWERIGAKAQSILARPELARLFGTQSRAEVPLLAHATRRGRPITIAGRVDRLVATGQRVLIVDFKSDARVPLEPVAIPASYRRQLALYARIAGQLFPDHTIEAAILWTSLESLMNLPGAWLAEAVEDFTIG